MELQVIVTVNVEDYLRRSKEIAELLPACMDHVDDIWSPEYRSVEFEVENDEDWDSVDGNDMHLVAQQAEEALDAAGIRYKIEFA